MPAAAALQKPYTLRFSGTGTDAGTATVAAPATTACSSSRRGGKQNVKLEQRYHYYYLYRDYMGLYRDYIGIV